MAAMTKKVVLVTGGNTGIGWETVKAMLQSGQSYHVFLGSRSLVRGEEAAASLRKEVPATNSTIETIQVDVESDESINQAYEKVKESLGYVDVLVNNAGAALDPLITSGKMTMRAAWNKDYDINVAGTQVLTHTFIPLLLKSSNPRLIFVTSGLSSLENLANGVGPAPPKVQAGWPKTGMQLPTGYRSSKTALNMMMLSWHWDLQPDGVKVWAVSPGFLATGLGGDKAELERRGAGHPSIGGKLITSVIEGDRDADVGKVVAGHGVQPF